MTSSPSSYVVRNLFRSSGVYFLSSVLTNGAMFLNSIAVSWYFGKEGLGFFSLCLTAVVVGSILADLGLNTIIMRDHADRREGSTPSLELLLKVRVLAALAVTTIMIGGALVLLPASALLVSSAMFLILPRSISGVAESYLKARIQRRTFFLVEAIFSALQIVLVWGAAANSARLQEIFLILMLLESVKAVSLLLLLAPAVAKSGGHGDAEDPSFGQLMSQSIPFAIMALLSLFSERADLFFLAALRGTEETGIYAGAERFLMLGNLFAFSLYGSALPVFSSLRDDGEYGRVVRKTTIIVAIISLSAAAALALGAQWIIAATFRFADSVLVLRILAASLPGVVINSILRIALFSLKRERPVGTILLGALTLNALLNFLFIPRYGAIAAAWVAVGTEYLGTMGYTWLYLSPERPARQAKIS